MSETAVFVLIGLLLTGLFLFGFVYFLLYRKGEKFAEGLYFESSVGPIFYQVHGRKGPWVVLIHGLGGSTYTWRYILPELSEHFRVVNFDLWGFGSSSKSLEKPFTLDNQVAVIEELIDFLNIKEYNVVGHSMGGALAIWTKLHDPRVQKVVAISPAAHPQLVSKVFTRFGWLSRWTPLLINRNWVKRLLLKLLVDPTLVDTDMIEAYHRPYQNPKAHKSFAAALNIIKDPRVFSHLNKLDSSCCVLWGSKENVIPPSTMYKINEQLDDVPVKKHPFAKHLPTEDDPKWVIRQILSHLKSN